MIAIVNSKSKLNMICDLIAHNFNHGAYPQICFWYQNICQTLYILLILSKKVKPFYLACQFPNIRLKKFNNHPLLQGITSKGAKIKKW